MEMEMSPIEQECGGTRPQGPKWRSPRRRAIQALQAMSHYGGYIVEMEKAGLFDKQALPAMLESSFAHVDYSVHGKGWEFLRVKDQTQVAVVSLLNIAASAVRMGPRFAQAVMDGTAMAICKHYKDPFSLVVDQHYAERRALEAECRSKDWDDRQVQRAVRALMDKQNTFKIDKLGTEKWFFEQGGLGNNICLFFTHLLPHCTDDLVLSLIHDGSLIVLLKGNHLHADCNINSEGPTQALLMLDAVWSKRAAALSRDAYKSIQAEDARALALRQQGNNAFKAGQLQQALDVYWRAVQQNPQDAAVFNNISLVALRLGDTKQALQAAEEAVRLDPTSAKSWGRLGDAFQAVGRWQLAHLAYSCGLEMSPKAEDLHTRQREARSHLSEVWSIDDIPAYEGPCNTGVAALQWMRIRNQAEAELLSNRDTAFDRFSGSSRYRAWTWLKKEVDDARALAVATGMLRVSALPRSCAHLKRPQQLPLLEEEWQISFTDMPHRHVKSGVVRHLLLVTTSKLSNRTITPTLGAPGTSALKRALLAAMLNPQPSSGEPGRPVRLMVPYRLFPFMHMICDLAEPWGIKVVAQTRAEAVQSAKDQDNHWNGPQLGGALL